MKTSKLASKPLLQSKSKFLQKNILPKDESKHFLN